MSEARRAVFWARCFQLLGVVLPSFIIILLIAKFLHNFKDNRFVKAFLDGVKPVVIALISSTGIIVLLKCLIINLTSPDAGSFSFDFLFPYNNGGSMLNDCFYYKENKEKKVFLR